METCKSLNESCHNEMILPDQNNTLGDDDDNNIKTLLPVLYTDVP